MSTSEFLDPQGLAAYLGVPLRTVYAWRSRGEGPQAFRVGRHVRYRRCDVEKWIEGRALADQRRVVGA
jgi:excisionase family DNA binding protein